jgi:hypothetical protein
MPKFIVDLDLDGYETEQEMALACKEFILESLNFSASTVSVADYDENEVQYLRESMYTRTGMEAAITKHFPEMIAVPVEHCSCGDYGYNVVTDHDGDPMQEQCEFCYTVPWSAHNVQDIKLQYEQRNLKTISKLKYGNSPTPF